MSQQRHERILVASTPMLNQYRLRALKMFPRPRGIGVRAKCKSHTHHHFLRLGLIGSLKCVQPLTWAL